MVKNFVSCVIWTFGIDFALPAVAAYFQINIYRTTPGSFYILDFPFYVHVSLW